MLITSGGIHCYYLLLQKPVLKRRMYACCLCSTHPLQISYYIILSSLVQFVKGGNVTVLDYNIKYVRISLALLEYLHSGTGSVRS